MTRVKICGITNIDDALAAVSFGADALGFIFHEASGRYVTPEKAGKIISALPPYISAVGVVVDKPVEDINSIVEISGVDTVQLHGNETPEFCFQLQHRTVKALRINDCVDKEDVELYPVEAILFDSYSDREYGGTGRTFRWELLAGLDISKYIILSGGLDPENVADAIRAVRPYAVDVSSGVEESPGMKNKLKMKKFIEAVKNGD